MTEEINHSYDGGLYAELIRNRAFLDDAASPAHWSAVHGDGAAAAIALDRSQPLNAAIATSVRLDVTQASAGHPAGIANEGYWGIPVRPNTRYRASFFAKAAPGFTGPITAAIESEDGTTTFATGRVSGVTQAWKQYEVTLTTARLAPTAKARFVLTVDRPATIWFSLVSLFPPTYQKPGQRLPSRPAADAHRHAAEVPPLSGRQLSRRRSDRGPLRVEEDARAVVGAPRPHGAVGLSLDRWPRPARVPAVGRGHERRAGARRLRRLLAQRRVREAGTRSRAVHPGCARRDRVRHRPGLVEVGIGARQSRPSRAVQADLRRSRQRRLLRSAPARTISASCSSTRRSRRAIRTCRSSRPSASSIPRISASAASRRRSSTSTTTGRSRRF